MRTLEIIIVKIINRIFPTGLEEGDHSPSPTRISVGWIASLEGDPIMVGYLETKMEAL